jgi:hypothetical protein
VTTSISTITVDSVDAKAQAGFWSAVLDRTVAPDASPDFAQVEGQPAIAFTKVPERKKGKNRVHLDLEAANLGEEVDRIVALGASRLADVEEDGYRWTTLADPEGNEFDVVASA